MKTKILIILSSLCLFATIQGFAYCGGGSDGGGCGNTCSEYDSTCQCTDPNCGKNPCLSRSDCCEAFGNVGAR